MIFLYKDMQKMKSLYKCRDCGYKEEEYDKEVKK